MHKYYFSPEAIRTKLKKLKGNKKYYYSESAKCWIVSTVNFDTLIRISEKRARLLYPEAF